jgi:hypothetical protein
MNPLLFLAVIVISLSSGLAVYRFGLLWILHRPFRFRDWSSYGPFYLAFGIAVMLVYLPVFWWMRERLKGTRALLVFPLAGALLSVMPIYGLKVSGDSRLADPASTEARIIYAMFVTSGFVFGLFYPGLISEKENER